MSNREVWDVLVEECGARPDQFPEFDYHFPQCGEFRFMGTLGFGGKVFSERTRPPWVSCYRENSSAEREAAIRRANVRLANLGAVTS